MHIIHRLLRLPIVRNLSGAAAGAVIAMVLYGFYTVSSTAVAALIPDHTAQQRVEEKARADKLIQTALRAKQIAEGLH